MIKRILLLLTVTVIVVAMAMLGGGPAIAAKAGDVTRSVTSGGDNGNPIRGVGQTGNAQNIQQGNTGNFD